MKPDPYDCRDPDLLAAEVRRLRAVIDSGAPVVARTQSGELSDPDLVANLLALADWQESDDLAAILRTAASRLNALAKHRLTDAEREAIEWAITKTSQRYDDPIGPIQRERLRRLLARTP
jgi:hypothetical protein